MANYHPDVESALAEGSYIPSAIVSDGPFELEAAESQSRNHRPDVASSHYD